MAAVVATASLVSVVIFTTHEPALAAEVAEFVLLLRQGQILASGPMRDVLTSERLSATYGVPVEVVTVGGRRVILPSLDRDAAPSTPRPRACPPGAVPPG